MTDWLKWLVCWLYGHDHQTVDILWGGHDYERVTRCRRCGTKAADKSPARDE